MVLAKARLVALARDAPNVPAATEGIARLVRANPWRGVGVALGLGLALGLSRDRGVRAVGTVVGPLGAALAAGFLRQFVLGASRPTSALDAKIAEVRSRSSVR